VIPGIRTLAASASPPVRKSLPMGATAAAQSLSGSVYESRYRRPTCPWRHRSPEPARPDRLSHQSQRSNRAYDPAPQGGFPAAIRVEFEPGEFPVTVLRVIRKDLPCGVPGQPAREVDNEVGVLGHRISLCAVGPPAQTQTRAIAANLNGEPSPRAPGVGLRRVTSLLSTPRGHVRWRLSRLEHTLHRGRFQVHNGTAERGTDGWGARGGTQPPQMDVR
jgi:hypothetical protein